MPGVPAEWVDARRAIVTNDDHTRATPLMRETTAALRASVRAGDRRRARAGARRIRRRDGGRAHDHARAAAGRTIPARWSARASTRAEIQIWTDVDGMLTADPRVIAKPRLVPQLSFAEAAELAYFGAKVLHPSTILPAVERNIPVRILNSLRPEGTGTLITADAVAGRDAADRPGLASATSPSSTSRRRRMLMAYGFLRRVFEVFERFRTAVDVVTTSEVSVSVTVDDRRTSMAITEALSEFARGRRPSRTWRCSAPSAIGCATSRRSRRAWSGVLEEVPLRMISQAASRRNITVVLRQADLPHAMQRLHEEFFVSEWTEVR